MENKKERELRYAKEEARAALFTLAGFKCGLTQLSEHGELRREIGYINEKFNKLYNIIQELNLNYECMLDKERKQTKLGETPSSNPNCPVASGCCGCSECEVSV
tara:strand:+ start:2304 stop:2615 length:312 start_codon:yes stop_codon:yes gene_type:complete